MRGKLKILCVVLAALFLSGCSMRTLDQMYCLPKRSEEYNDLQSAIDRHMDGRSYCAPLSGENPQSVQIADLDGDGVGEYLLFAKGTSERPLNILIFRLEDGEYVLADTIESSGSAFDVVEYANIDDRPGFELVVGRQVSDQLTRSLSVYQFVDRKIHQLLNVNYSGYVTCDMDLEGRRELMVLRAGGSAQSLGIVELYDYNDGIMERYNESDLSGTMERVKKIQTGRLQDGTPAVYVSSTMGADSILTDVFTVVDDRFTNITFSYEEGNSVQTLRNYYVYADDIDDDGIIELPDLMTMRSPGNMSMSDQQYLVRWFALDQAGERTQKMYTYHDYHNGWYVTLGHDWAERIAVVQVDDRYEFFLWDEEWKTAQKTFTVYVFTGEDREELSVRDNRFVLYRGKDTVYAAYLEVASASCGITQDSLIRSFHLIQQDWNTGNK